MPTLQQSVTAALSATLVAAASSRNYLHGLLDGHIDALTAEIGAQETALQDYRRQVDTLRNSHAPAWQIAAAHTAVDDHRCRVTDLRHQRAALRRSRRGLRDASGV